MILSDVFSFQRKHEDNTYIFKKCQTNCNFPKYHFVWKGVNAFVHLSHDLDCIELKLFRLGSKKAYTYSKKPFANITNDVPFFILIKMSV